MALKLAGLKRTMTAMREYHNVLLRTGEAPFIVEAESMRRFAQEDEGWTPLGVPRRDLKPWNQERMQEKVLALFRGNHMARRLLNVIPDFVIGDGITVVAKGDESDDRRKRVQDAIDEFWNDPVNAMDRNMGQHLTEWLLWGEQLRPVRIADNGKGRIRLGFIDPGGIAAVSLDPITSTPGTVRLKDSVAKAVGYDALDVVRFREAQEAVEGNAFFATRNNVISAGRGISELYTGHDWMMALDRTLRSVALRAELLNSYIWDVTLDGYDEPAIKKWLRENTKAPFPGMIKAHNGKVKWDAKGPDLGARENADFIQAIKTHIMGGFGYPNHWFGSGDDANLATATVMAEPTRRALRKISKDLSYVLTDMVSFALQKRAEADPRLAANEGDGALFEVRIPDISGPDVASAGAAVVAVTNAIVVAEERGFVSHETAMSLFAAIAAQTGLEIDPSSEKKKIEVEDKENGADEDRAALDREAAAAAALSAAMAAGKQKKQDQPPTPPPAAEA